jgi:hypothetical protein
MIPIIANRCQGRHHSSKGETLRWEMTEKRPRVLKNIFDYFIAILYSQLNNFG